MTKTHARTAGRKIARVLILGAAVPALAGCSGTGPTEPRPEAGGPEVAPVSSSAQAAMIADVAGSWIWTSEEHLTFPAFVAQVIIGIQPEGPTTTARCTNVGTMTLIQSGASFTGTANRTAHECVTKGGQIFQDPGAFAPLAIEDGEIRGRSFRLLLLAGPLACPHHGSVSNVQNGVATALKGGGRCIVPGHPKSGAPLDPPPLGTSKTLDWQALRL